MAIFEVAEGICVIIVAEVEEENEKKLLNTLLQELDLNVVEVSVLETGEIRVLTDGEENPLFFNPKGAEKIAKQMEEVLASKGLINTLKDTLQPS